MAFQFPRKDAAVLTSVPGTLLSIPAALLKIWVAEMDVDTD